MTSITDQHPPSTQPVLTESVTDDDEGLDEDEEDLPLVLQDLNRALTSASESPSLFDKTATAIPVAAITALLGVVQRSQSETMMGLQDELKRASQLMVANVYKTHRSYIALQSGCELFLKYITRTFLELPDFEACRKQVLERGERFHSISLAARDRIARSGADFVPANATILTHGWSRVVASILLQASKTKHFDLILLHGQPDASGLKAAHSYATETSIPVTVMPDAAMAYCMERVDVVLVGAEGVLENGGIVNKLGTYALATCAKAAGKPVYVAAESYKFARLFPLKQSDLPPYRKEEEMEATSSLPLDAPPQIKVEQPPVDFTPATFLTLLFTDLGVLTPSAVSDELIRLYQ